MSRLLMLAVGAVSAVAGPALAVNHRPIPEYILDLDLPVEQRYEQIYLDFNASLHVLWDFFFGPTEEGRLLLDFMEGLALERGPENEVMENELVVLSRMFGKPLLGVRSLQMLYELQTLMVPIENITLPWMGPGCTGIIARNTENGKVYHARNLDFSPLRIMENVVYTAIFTRGGVEQYRYQTIAGYQMAITGMKRGPNGFTIERNTRYTDHEGGNEEMIKNLLVDKVDLNGWSIRRAFETCGTYECAVDLLSTAPYTSTEYSIISGVKKGTIIARNPTNVAHKLELGKLDVDLTDPNYIIVTNFDFWWKDVREWFDATGGQIGRPRRIVAQKELATLPAYTPEALFETINKEGVLADTIMQAIMSVEDDLYNLTLPDWGPKHVSPMANFHHSSRKFIDMWNAAYERVKAGAQ